MQFKAGVSWPRLLLGTSIGRTVCRNSNLFLPTHRSSSLPESASVSGMTVTCGSFVHVLDHCLGYRCRWQWWGYSSIESFSAFQWWEHNLRKLNSFSSPSQKACRWLVEAPWSQVSGGGTTVDWSIVMKTPLATFLKWLSSLAVAGVPSSCSKNPSRFYCDMLWGFIFLKNNFCSSVQLFLFQNRICGYYCFCRGVSANNPPVVVPSWLTRSLSSPVLISVCLETDLLTSTWLGWKWQPCRNP